MSVYGKPWPLIYKKYIWPYLREEYVQDVEDHEERELGGEQCKEPLTGVHVGL